MRKFNLKKTIATAGVVCMMSGLLCACGKSDKDTGSASTAATTAATTAAATTEAGTTAATTQAATTQAQTTQAATTQAQTTTQAATTQAQTTQAQTTQAQTTQAPAKDFSGTYVEPNAGRGVVTVSKQGNQYMVQVDWPGSAYEVGSWVMYGTFNDNGVMNYTGGILSVTTFSEENADGETLIEYEDGSGTITITDAGLTWVDNKDNVAAGTTFIKQ